MTCTASALFTDVYGVGDNTEYFDMGRIFYGIALLCGTRDSHRRCTVLG